MTRKGILFLVLLTGLAFIGCGGPGDDGIPTGINVNNTSILGIVPKISLNKTTLGASIRAALNTQGAQLYMTLKDGSTLPLSLQSDTTSSMVFGTSTYVSVTSLVSSGGYYTLYVYSIINGVTVPITMRLTTALGATTTTGSTSDVTANVSLTTDSSGKITYTYNVQYIPAGSTTSTNSGTQQPPSGTTPTTLPDLYIEKITSLDTSTETTLSQSLTTGIPTYISRFRVYFNKTVSAAPTSVTVYFKTATKTTMFTNSGTAQASVSLDSGQKSLTLTVYGQTGSDPLAPSTAYDLSFASSNISASGSTGSASLTIGNAYKIQTSASTSTTTTTTTSTSTATTTLAISKIVFATGTSEVTLSNASETPNVGFASPTLRVYFTNPILAAPTTFTMAANGYVQFSNTDSSLQLALSSDKRILTVNVNGQSANAKLSPYTSYTLTFDSSTITADTNASSTMTMNNGVSYKIQTKKTVLTSWDAQVAVSSSTYTTTKTGNTVGSNTTRVLFTFDYPVTPPTDLAFNTAYTVTKNVSGVTTTIIYKDYFTTPTASGSTVIQPFVSGKRLTPGNYSVSITGGTFTDSASKPIDTTASVTFTVQ